MVPNSPEVKTVSRIRFPTLKRCYIPSFSLIGWFCKKGQNLGWVEWFQTAPRSKRGPESYSPTSKAATYQVSAWSDNSVKNGQNLGWVKQFQTARRSKRCPESDFPPSKDATYQVSAWLDDSVKRVKFGLGRAVPNRPEVKTVSRIRFFTLERRYIPSFSLIGQLCKKVIIGGGSSGSKQLRGRNGVQNRVLHPGEPYVPIFRSIGLFHKKVIIWEGLCGSKQPRGQKRSNFAETWGRKGLA